MVLCLLGGCASLPALNSHADHGQHVCPCCSWGNGDPATAAARQRHANEDVQGLAKLADDGNAEAEYLMALRLYRGDGVARDRAASMRWLRQAAFLDHPAAQYVMGRSYAAGDGVERDAQQAMRWYELSAAQNFGPAMLALADLYRESTHLAADPQKAAALYRRLDAISRCRIGQQAREALAQAN